MFDLFFHYLQWFKLEAGFSSTSVFNVSLYSIFIIRLFHVLISLQPLKNLWWESNSSSCSRWRSPLRMQWFTMNNSAFSSQNDEHKTCHIAGVILKPRSLASALQHWGFVLFGLSLRSLPGGDHVRCRRLKDACTGTVTWQPCISVRLCLFGVFGSVGWTFVYACWQCWV